jgi:hypothetical protein
MRSRWFDLTLLVSVTIGTAMTAMAQPQWTGIWQGVDRPGPENLPFTTGWPADPAGFEQYDPADCFAGTGPHYGENPNVDSDGYLSMQNMLDLGCFNVGPNVEIDENDWPFLMPCEYEDPSPCGMRYHAGPRTKDRTFWAENESEIPPNGVPQNVDHDPEALHYQESFGFNVGEARGMTFEFSIFIASPPTTPLQWANLLDIRAYFDENAVGGNPGSGELQVLIRDNLTHGELAGGNPPANEWYIVVQDNAACETPGCAARRVINLGRVDDFIGKWVTIRIGVGVWCDKVAKFAWRDGVFMPLQFALSDERDVSGAPTGRGPNTFAVYGSKHLDGDIRYGTMAWSNQGLFSPNPAGECILLHCGLNHYLPYLPSVAKTPANSEICDNATDDDGDGDIDCDDSECFQDATCGNLLVNGSFEEAVSSGICPSSAQTPLGWQPDGIDKFRFNDGAWAPVDRAWTDATNRGSVASGSVASAVMYQTVPASGQVRLRGDLNGAGSATCFVELRDGGTGGALIDRFDFPGSPADSTWRAFDIEGPAASGQVTVRWGYEGAFGVNANHADNFYLVGAGCGREVFADADEDTDVDQDDFASLQACFTGMGELYTDPACLCFDVDPPGAPDGDIDLMDYQAFRDCATGPDVPLDPGNPPPGCDL